MKLLAYFAYNADVIPKGARKPRREILFGTTQFEIAETTSDRVVRDALVVGFPGRLAADHPLKQLIGRPLTTFTGYNGALWSPLGEFDPAEFERQCQTLYPISGDHYPRNNPLDHAYDQTYGPRYIESRANYIDTNHEDNFAGKVLDNNRIESLQRYLKVAQDILIIDGTLHARAAEPGWYYSQYGNQRIYLREAGFKISNNAPGEEHMFRLNRLDDVHEWNAQFKRQPCVTEGTIEQLHPEFLCRDDLSNFVNIRIHDLAIKHTAAFLPYLPPALLPGWQRLAKTADRTDHREDIPLPADADVLDVIAEVKTLYEAMQAARLPGELHDKLPTLLRNHYGPFMQRIEFELAKQPRPKLAAEDALAMAKIAV